MANYDEASVTPVDDLATTMFREYGPLITLPKLAQILDRQADGVRMTLFGNSSYAKRLNKAKVRLGRRLYFRTLDVAKILLGTD